MQGLPSVNFLAGKGHLYATFGSCDFSLSDGMYGICIMAVFCQSRFCIVGYHENAASLTISLNVGPAASSMADALSRYNLEASS